MFESCKYHSGPRCQSPTVPIVLRRNGKRSHGSFLPQDGSLVVELCFACSNFEKRSSSFVVIMEMILIRCFRHHVYSILSVPALLGGYFTHLNELNSSMQRKGFNIVITSEKLRSRKNWHCEQGGSENVISRIFIHWIAHLQKTDLWTLLLLLR